MVNNGWSPNLNYASTQEELKKELRLASLEIYKIELNRVTTEFPSRPEMGDIAFPVAFEIAKKLKEATGEKKAPRIIAEALKERLGLIDAVNRVEVAGAGYLNFFYDRPRVLSSLLKSTNKRNDAIT
ncbi:MAG: hypothetical protein ACRD4L_05020, partial [Pyrinomonadaceae bacterium]